MQLHFLSKSMNVNAFEFKCQIQILHWHLKHSVWHFWMVISPAIIFSGLFKAIPLSNPSMNLCDVKIIFRPWNYSNDPKWFIHNSFQLFCMQIGKTEYSVNDNVHAASHGMHPIFNLCHFVLWTHSKCCCRQKCIILTWLNIPIVHHFSVTIIWTVNWSWHEFTLINLYKFQSDDEPFSNFISTSKQINLLHFLKN